MDQPVRFESRLSVDAVLGALGEALEEGELRGGIRPRLAGTIDGPKISLYRRRPYSRGLPSLVFNGSVQGQGTGSAIEGRFERHDAQAPLFQVFGALMVVAGVFSLARGAWTLNIELALVGLLAGAGGALLVYGAPRVVRSFGSDESELLSEEIQHLLSEKTAG